MGSLSSTELSMPLSGIPAHFMSKNCGPRSCKYEQKRQNFTKDNLELQWLLWGTLQSGKNTHLRTTLESKGAQIKQTG